MHIDIQFRGIDGSSAVREHAERRARFALGRLAGRISRVNIALVDINGPRGGEDKACTVQISLQQSGSVLVEELGADLYQVLDRSLGRAARTLGRRMDRQSRQRFAARAGRVMAEAEMA